MGEGNPISATRSTRRHSTTCACADVRTIMMTPRVEGSKDAATTAAEVKPYANLCGLFAVSAHHMANPTVRSEYIRMVAEAVAAAPPSFD